MESLLHVGGGVLGVLVVVGLVGAVTGPLLWRSAALASALTLVVRGLFLLAGLGRSEWRRERPSTAVYAQVAGRFLLAFLLAGVATS
jgi:hypothetical protein